MQAKGQQISKQNCRAVTSPKTKRTNLFFYPYSPEILESSKSKFKFQVFPYCQDRKNKLVLSFFGESTGWQSAFRFYLTFRHCIQMHFDQISSVGKLILLTFCLILYQNRQLSFFRLYFKIVQPKDPLSQRKMKGNKFKPKNPFWGQPKLIGPLFGS